MTNYLNQITFDTDVLLDGPIKYNETLNNVNGSTSGTVSWSMPFQGSSHKKVVIYCDALVGTAVVTFPVAFQYTPVNLITSNGLDTINVVTTTQTTITGTTSTGFIVIEGF